MLWFIYLENMPIKLEATILNVNTDLDHEELAVFFTLINMSLKCHNEPKKTSNMPCYRAYSYSTRIIFIKLYLLPYHHNRICYH